MPSRELIVIERQLISNVIAAAAFKAGAGWRYLRGVSY